MAEIRDVYAPITGKIIADLSREWFVKRKYSQTACPITSGGNLCRLNEIGRTALASPARPKRWNLERKLALA